MPTPFEVLFVCGIIAHGLQYVSTNKDIAKRMLYKEIQCPYPTDISHGIYQCTSKWPLYLNDVCSLHCAPGFKPRTSPTSIKCLSNETWSASTDCVEVQCPVQTVAYGQLTCNGTVPYTRLDICELTCQHGYRRINHLSVCLQNETWSQNPKCEEVPCPPLPQVQNGRLYCARSGPYKWDDICDLQCDNGFQPSNHLTHTRCFPGVWSTFASCVEISCPALPNVTNGHFFCVGGGPYKMDDICDLQCDSGFKPSSHIGHTQCLSTGIWSSSASCVEIICPDPKPLANGRFICNNPSPLKQNDVCQLHCDHGYTLTSDLVAMVCLSSSTWSSHSSCDEIKCYTPPIVSHGHYKCGNSTSYKIDTVCPLQCDQGYKPSSHSLISCLDEDNWSAAGTCDEIHCQNPPMVDNGQYHCSHNDVHNVDDVCHLQCNNGYKIRSRHSEIYCLNNGSWSSSASCKEILCPDPPKLDHGSYVCREKAAYKLNGACVLECNEGYKPIKGGNIINCQMDSTWSKPSTCKEKECDTLPMVDHGRVSCNSTVYHISTACQLQCDPGFKPSSLSDLVFCMEDETWTPVSCIEIKCPVTPKVANGKYRCVSSTIHKLNNVCHLQCASGHIPSKPHSDITCSSSGHWSTAASCEVSPRDCEVCSGSLCGVPGNDYLQQCPSSRPYCMNDMHNYINGTISVTKSCGSEIDCNSKWWHGTSDRTDCTDFNLARPKKRDLSCYFCCTVSGCNKDIIPDTKTMFIGHS